MTPFRRLTVFAGLGDVLLLATAAGLYFYFGQTSYLILAGLVAALLVSKLIGYTVARSTGREELGLVIYSLAFSLIIVLPVLWFTDYWWVGLILGVLLTMLPWLGGQPRLAVPLVLLALFSTALMLVLDIWLIGGERMNLVRNPWLAVLMAVGYVSLVLLPGLFSSTRLGEEKTGVFPRLLSWFLGVAVSAAVVVMAVILWQANQLQVEQSRAQNLRLANQQAERAGNLLEERLTTLQLLWHSATVVDSINAANLNYGYTIASPETRMDLQARNTEWQAAASNSELVRQYLLNEETQALARFVNAHPDYLTLIVTDKLGGLVAATGGKPGLFFYGDEPWWQAAMQGGDGAYVGNLAYDERLGAYTVLIAITVKDPSTVGEGADPSQGAVIGLLASTLDLRPIQLGLQDSPADFGGQMGLISPDGQVLAGADLAAVQAAWDELPASAFLTDQTSNVGFLSGTLGERVLIAHAPLKTTSGEYLVALGSLGWQMVVFQSENSILSGLNQVMQIAILVAVVALMLAVWASWRAAAQVRKPISVLTDTAQKITQGNLDQHVPPGGLVEWNQLSGTFNQMLAHVQQILADKDRQVAASTEVLEERTRQIQAAAEVGRSAASILNADELIQEVVGFIRSRFNLYYVGLFLVDETGEWAMLRAGTGEAGKVMQARGHRIRVGQGMIGWSIANQLARVAGEAGTDAVRLATAELPETRAEAALPLISRGRVIGALTVQSAQEGFFTESTVVVLQTMADQVAVALDNASLFAESQLAMDALRRSYGEVSGREWVGMMHTRQVPGYSSDERGVYPVKDDPAARSMGVKKGGLEVPVKVRDQVLGMLTASKPKGDNEWSEEEVALLETLAGELSVALENARLYESTQRRAERERVLADITAKVRSSTDINMILQTAIQELADALRVSRGKIELHQADDDGENGGNTDD